MATADRYIDFVFDRPPAPDSPLVEVETSSGKSVQLGTWTNDGELWRLRVTEDEFRAAIEGKR